MTLVSTKKVIRRSWHEITTPDTVIAKVNTLVQGQLYDLEVIDKNKRPIWDLDTTWVDDGETDASPIEVVE